MSKVYAAYKQAIAGDEATLLRDRLHPFDMRKEFVEQVLKSAGKQSPDFAEKMVHLYKMLRERSSTARSPLASCSLVAQSVG